MNTYPNVLCARPATASPRFNISIFAVFTVSTVSTVLKTAFLRALHHNQPPNSRDTHSATSQPDEKAHQTFHNKRPRALRVSSRYPPNRGILCIILRDTSR